MPRGKKRNQQARDGLYQTSDSPYWQLSFTPTGGERIRRSTKTVDHSEAEIILANLKLQHRKAVEFGDQPNRSFFDVIGAYRDANKNKASKDRDNYSLQHLYPYFQDAIMNKLTGADVRSYIALRLRSVKPATVNREIGLVSAAINYCIAQLDWELPNPFMGKALPENNNRERWLTRSEAEALIRAARTAKRAPHLPLFIQLALNTGMRKSEMLGLEWSRVDLGRGEVHLKPEHQKNRKVGVVPLNAAARAAIVELGKLRTERCPSSPWLFCSASGAQIKNVRKSFSTAVKKADLQNVRIHDLRRTCGSWMAQAGVPIQQISELLRHSDISTTHKRYAHLAPSNIAAAVSVLDQIHDSNNSVLAVDFGGQ